MLLNSYKISRILPCIADPEKIRVIAELSEEIHEIFPYLNAVIKGCIYNHPALTLTIRNEEKLITLHAKHVTMTLIEDEKEAQEILNWLKDLINETYQKKDQIEPNYSEGDMQMAGFQVSVTDDSPDLVQKEKFPKIEGLTLGDMEQVARDLQADPNTYIVILSKGVLKR